ncbi:SulP family inorganic anion transporter [Vibrio splendidus]|uniref:Sulfate permease n=2 Tax=Vibrio TaxID=662 RepID=A0A4R3P9C4_9VIBR|nr:MULTISPECIES: SulP family inorganic anion transporter [Vibrio]MDH5919822.1 SulP family inorganic anion transporter [Vibrio splendidus]TCN05632.1 SulP family sulfate permease [Vibrio crassostreae]TCT46138.1 SulP family sulfate permease [Vibrio crassostreae]TCT54255.1 SulP family sulfate permease [Vibrio crassostreae]TCT58878.1 SulP family sulfate permease [Vibrio crassostreae]
MIFNREQWLGNTSKDALSGVVVALALIPEAIAFSIIAGLDPKVGLYASFCICVVTAFTGARSGMISAATGAMALLMTTLVKNYGLDYLLAATILTGVIQYIIGLLKLGAFMRFVAKSIVTGFINALAILIFMAQLPELTNVTWHVYALTAGGLAIIYLMPYVPVIGKLVPSPLVCIIAVTAISVAFGIDVRTVGDMGSLPDSLPIFMLPNIPLNFETLQIIFPYSLALAVVGVLESLMTATIIDDITDTDSDKNKECKGQGIANIAAGLMGGMAGCAMIGQSMVNMKSGGRTRLSTLCAGVFLLIMVVFLGDLLKQIPMAALVAVMIMVSISTFSWKSIKELKHNPKQSNVIMLATVIVVVTTHNLALGVLAGVILASIFFTNSSISMVNVEDEIIIEGEHITHMVHGQIFFASAHSFIDMFPFDDEHPFVTIDLHQAQMWDITAVDALDKVVMKFMKTGKEVVVVGMNEQTNMLIDKYAIFNKPEKLAAYSIGH